MPKSFERSVLSFAAAVALVMAPGSASAQVRYDFTAFSSFNFSGEQVSGAFAVELPGFVTANTIVPLSALLSCTVVTTPDAPAACRDQGFLLDVEPGYTTVSFGIQTDLNPGTGVYYYFGEAAFSTPGTHESQLFGADQAARLVVTVVPEPGQWALLALGLGVLAATARRAGTRA